MADIIEQNKKDLESFINEEIYKQRNGTLWMNRNYIFKHNIKDNTIICYARFQKLENKTFKIE